MSERKKILFADDEATTRETLPLLVDEMRVLERIVLRALEKNLIRIDLSFLFEQLRFMNEFSRVQPIEALCASMSGPTSPIHTAA